ncbi:hypothetical protein GTS_57390 [Gandjariella thermophila]|uniref:Uncharacterized protein n=1 Tax=Gandjariella thermophila TaxID=1931992 RepID=A0A4D4JI62_9PSEU|nr:hypothetical protein GTS_57390 [Gandjariella thermophila]
MKAFQPAFEVTNVESMQWNRTSPLFTGNEPTARAAAPLPAEVLARVQEAVKREAAYVKR